MKSKKASVTKSLGLLTLAVGLALSVRWLLVEPFVIPSGSMIPTLLIHDHIFVTKYSFGVRWPFTSTWLVSPSYPKRGDIVVFRSVESADYYMIKRVVGLPGDRIKLTSSGELYVNDEIVNSVPAEYNAAWSEEDLGGSLDDFELRREKLDERDHYVLNEKNSFRSFESAQPIADGHVFLMGDNRDRSRDSRFWGELPVENLLGRARFVWLSCGRVVVQGTFLCDPRYIRWQRFFHRIE